MTRRSSKGRNSKAQTHRLQRRRAEGLQSLGPTETPVKKNAHTDCGWGRLVFSHTFDSAEELVETLQAESADRRDIAFYVQEPHVLLAMAPQELFLDPSHTYRLDLATYRMAARAPQTFVIRRLTTESDAEAINKIYAENRMVPVRPDFFWSTRDARELTVLVAEDSSTGDILGTVMGVDHHLAFDDPERGSSLWCLAVSPTAPHAGLGEALIRRLAEHFQAKGAGFMDLSVLHDNENAIALYDKLGFRRVPVFAVKRKNPINEKLFTGNRTVDGLNPYARIITNEAYRRGISVDVDDAEGGLFTLTYGGRSIRCREALSELTSAVAMSICDDKRVTRRVAKKAGLRVPDQISTDDKQARADFLAKHNSVVVKPARGEMGKGVAVDIQDVDAMEDAVTYARSLCPDVIVEQFFRGDDLRLVVIDGKVVAAAMRKPAHVVGDGQTDLLDAIKKQSRRRAAATDGESVIPLDAETERCVREQGYELDDVVEKGVTVQVRKTANLHTGGMIIDVTDEVHPDLTEAAIRLAREIDIPVTGIDFLIRNPHEPDYVFIEANERPGLANHEPRPTAERFVDLLFPTSIPATVRNLKRQRA